MLLVIPNHQKHTKRHNKNVCWGLCLFLMWHIRALNCIQLHEVWYLDGITLGQLLLWFGGVYKLNGIEVKIECLIMLPKAEKKMGS